MIGKEYTSNEGNTIKILSKISPSAYTYHCSVCSKDTELFPDPLVISKSSISRNGSGSCGCGRCPKWTDYQYKVRIARAGKIFGFDVLSWWETPSPRNTERFEILVDGRVKQIAIVNALVGNGCSKHTKRDYEYYKNIFENQTNRIVGTVFYKSDKQNSYGTKSFWKYYCPVCSNDKYVKAGFCDELFEIAHSSALLGFSACRCSPSARKSFEMRDLDIKDKLYHMGWKFVKYVTGDLKTRTKFEFLCEKGHKNKITYKNLMRGDNCSTCSKSGFSRGKPAYLYLTRWYGFGESFIKFGITNKLVGCRVRQQASKAKLDYQILESYYSEDGGLIADLEVLIKSTMKGKTHACPESWLPDGFSETVKDTAENLYILNDTCERAVNVV